MRSQPVPFGWFARARRQRKKDFRVSIKLVSPAMPHPSILDKFLTLFSRRPHPPDPAAFDQLTPREREVAMLAAQGDTNKAIAAQLVITEDTVKAHMRNIRSKLGVRSKTELRLLWANRDWSESDK
jgi:DNA-binding NarL/FixJ family response regulator